MLDFSKVKRDELSMDELCKDLTMQDLHRLTDEMIDKQLALIHEATDADVAFIPDDPEAYDSFAEDEADVNLAWTLGHVMVHVTASSEESAAIAANLARGVLVEGRMRHETPWETVTTIEQVRHRMEESRRIRHAFLNAWPDQPHLETTITPKYPGATPRNAVVQFVGGLRHDDSHLGQIKNIMEQVKAHRSNT
jgi:hypothetical protein